MLKYLGFGLFVLVLAGVTYGEPGLILVDEKGGSREWEIFSYRPPNDEVKLKGPEGTVSKSFSALDEKEKQTVILWLTDRKFKSSSGFKVSLVKQKTEREWDPSKYIGGDDATLQASYRSLNANKGSLEDISYDIVLENKSAVAFPETEVCCRVFYERDTDGAQEKHVLENTFTCDLMPGEKKIIHSGAVEIRDIVITYPDLYYSNGGQVGGKPTEYFRDELEGVHLSVRRTSAEGEVLERLESKGKLPRESLWAEYKADHQPIQVVTREPEEASVEVAADLRTPFSIQVDGSERIYSSYNPRAEIVKVKGTSGSTSVALCDLDEADQKRVLGWYIDKKFDSSSFRVSVEEEREKGEEDGRDDIIRMFYEIDMESRLGVELGEVEITCVSFYEELEDQLSGVWKKYQVEHQRTLRFEKDDTHHFIVEPVADYARHWGHGSHLIEAELKGIRMFVRRVDSSGEIQERIFEEGRVPRESQRSSYATRDEIEFAER